MNNSKDEILIKKLLREMVTGDLLVEARDDWAITLLTRWIARVVRQYLVTRTPGTVAHDTITLSAQDNDVIESLPGVNFLDLKISTILGRTGFRSRGTFKKTKLDWGSYDYPQEKEYEKVITIEINIGEHFKLNSMHKGNISLMSYLVTSIKGTLAHEIQHAYQFSTGEKMRYKDSVVYKNGKDPVTGKVRSVRDSKSLSSLKGYYSSKIEVEAYTAGIRKRARHLNTSFEEELLEFIETTYENKKKGLSDKDAAELRHFLDKDLKVQIQEYYDKRYPKSRIKPTEEVK